MKIIYVRLRISPIHFNYHKKFNTILTWVLMKSLSDHAPKRSEKKIPASIGRLIARSISTMKVWVQAKRSVGDIIYWILLSLQTFEINKLAAALTSQQ